VIGRRRLRGFGAADLLVPGSPCDHDAVACLHDYTRVLPAGAGGASWSAAAVSFSNRARTCSASVANSR